MATLTSNICFKEARDMRLRGQIDLDDYLKHIVAHYGSIRHEADTHGHWPWIPAGFESEVRKVALDTGLPSLDEDNTEIMHSIFLSAFKRNAAAVGSMVRSSTLAWELYIRPLVAIALKTGDAHLLRLCFELGYRPTNYNDAEDMLECRCNKTTSTEWLDVLYEYDFRQWRTETQERLSEWETWRYVFNMGPECTRWWIDHGGRTPSARGLLEHDAGWPGAPTFRVLLEKFGVGWFTNSGTLQLAIKKLDFETVKLLVQWGADVNEDVEDWNYDVRERRAAPLPALVTAIYAKSEDMIRYLVDHGAKVSSQHFDDPYNTDRKEYIPYKKLVAELGAIGERQAS